MAPGGQGSQQFSFNATTAFQGLVGQEGTNRAKVAEILAKGQVAAQVIQALQSGNEVKGVSFTITSGGKIQQQVDSNAVDPKERQALLGQFEQLVGAKCASCHSNGTKKGGLDLSGYLTFSQAQKQAVWDRITTTDQARMMPRDPSGGPGIALTAQEKRLFFLN